MTLTDKQIRTYFKNVFGFRVRHVDLYRTALIHRSATSVSTFGMRENNERLEFLGDAVLDMMIADFLCRKYPFESEGFLTQARSKMVNRQCLGSLAMKLGLHDITQTAGKIHSKYIPGNTFEAVVGAIYRDQGYKKTVKIILDNVFLVHLDIDAIMEEDKDYKSRLLIWAQHNKRKVTFSHETIHEREGDVFHASVIVDEQFVSEGINTSVKAAEQRASELALEILE